MSRNKNRVAQVISDVAAPESAPQPSASPFNFIVPTEMVDIPSEGKFYPEGHPLHNVDSIEIRHLTAKEEDILTSQSLIKKGLAINKLLESIIIDKRIKVDDLLIGDKNALLIASRIYGYGPDYNVTLNCGACSEEFKTIIDLNDFNLKSVNLEDIKEAVEKTDNNTFVVTLPKSQFVIEFRLLTSRDEMILSKVKSNSSTGILKTIIVSINGQNDSFFIDRALQALPILDASLLKRLYAGVMPDVDMSCGVECTNCGEEFEVEVPLTAEFFWPNV
jgi:hypothetical protein